MRIVKQQKNVLEVEVTTAVKANQDQVERIKKLVEKKYPGKTVFVKETIKGQILGGIQIKIGSEVVDATLKSQLASIGKECVAVAN